MATLTSSRNASRSRQILFVLGVSALGAFFLPRMWPHLLWAIDGIDAPDFSIFASAARIAWTGGDIYLAEACDGCAYRYSPLFAYLFAPLAALGLTVWTGLHVAALAALPWRVAVMVPLLWPFWWELGTGSNMIFVTVLAYHALQGRRWAIVGTLAVALLIPRPLMVPIVAWLLWQQPYVRLPFVIGAVASVAFAVVTGHLDGWIAVMRSSTSEMDLAFNLGPSAVIGWFWIPVGIALSAWLTWKGRIGWAALAASPYWLPYYLLIVLIDLLPEAGAEALSSQADARSRPVPQAASDAA